MTATFAPTAAPSPSSRPVYTRRVIRITAEDSPNVRLARMEIAAGRRPSGRVVVPGVLTWRKYLNRRKNWDPVRQTIGLDARFYEGAEHLMFPPDRLTRAERFHLALLENPPWKGRTRRGKGIGIDPAEGGDSSCWSVVDEWGLIELLSVKTPDTTVIPEITLRLMSAYSVPADRVCFDRGGGGKQAADQLRRKGHPVRTVAFGESLGKPARYGRYTVEESKEIEEIKYAWKNRRAQMFGELMMLLDPAKGVETDHPGIGPDEPEVVLDDDGHPVVRKVLIGGAAGWGLPSHQELRRQMAPIPLLYDKEQRLYVLPKHADRTDEREKKGIVKTLIQLIGHSPDELDSLALAVHAMLHGSDEVSAGAL